MPSSASTTSRANKRNPYLPGPTDRRIDALLTLLAENPTIVISGAGIAKEIGVKRQTVWKWIETLRAAGVKVKGHPRSGYHIERAPDVLAPQLISRHLRGTFFGKRILHFFQTESTNDVALRLGETGEPHGTVIVAEKQTAGRGRAGHTWVSEASTGIYVTVLLRPPISPLQSPALTIAAGLAARDAIAEETGLSPDIRWPNDVLLNGKKVCGILTEMQAEPDRIHFAAVGIGINVNHTKMPPELSGIATSLRMETGRAHSRLDLLVRLLRRLDHYYNQFVTEGTAPILRQFAQVSSYAEGKRVRITTDKESFAGTTAGLEPSGILRVRRDDGKIELVISGGVSEAK
jgi:BirA family biotin operon repressor/biotin-[acetyl-CoA-carboxylase] ligase